MLCMLGYFAFFYCHNATSQTMQYAANQIKIEYKKISYRCLFGRQNRKWKYSGSDLIPKGRWFEPHRHHCVVSLSKNINSSLVLVQPRKTRPYITERLLMGRKESNQTNKEQVVNERSHFRLCDIRSISTKTILLRDHFGHIWPLCLKVYSSKTISST